jgi:hypothetical protein
MSNYNKSFNFRNGVQVDDSHFIVNSSGLVGIGTSLPTQLLDVSGNINASGLVQTNNLKTLGISTLAETRVGIGITLDPTTGIITANYFYGNGSTLSYLPTSQWINIDVGFGYTSIYAQGNVGVATNDPRYALQIGGRPDITGQAGVGINSSGGMIVTGVVTSYSGFSGPGLGITQLNANYLVVGSISTTRLPIIPNALIPIYISAGIVTASSGFVGNLTGNVSGNINGNYVQAGIVTATNIFQGSLAGAAITATYITAGIITTTGNGVYGSLFGPVFGNVIGALTGVVWCCAGLVTTLAGSGSEAYADGQGAQASFGHPTGVAVDSAGTVYVADYAIHRIRKVTSAGERSGRWTCTVVVQSVVLVLVQCTHTYR